MGEWTNPILYLNLAGFLTTVDVLLRRRRLEEAGRLAGPWFAATVLLCVATGLHFIGDLAGVSEDADHVFIHAAVLVAFAIPAVAAFRS